MGPGTFSQIYLHFIIAVKFRETLIQPPQQQEVFPFITGMVNSMGHKCYAVNGMPDHVHIFMSFGPVKSPSDTIKEIMRTTTSFINTKEWFPVNFQWQGAYACFSYSRSQIDTVIDYIKNQKGHHSKMSFKEEYIAFLKKFEIEFDEKSLFEFFEE